MSSSDDLYSYKTKVQNQNSLKKFLAKAVSGSLAIKVLSTIVVYLNSLVFVRLFGSVGYGEYVYVIAWIQILLIPAAFGFEGLINRELAIYVAQKKWDLSRGLLRFANTTVLITSLISAFCGYILIALIGGMANLSYSLILTIGLVSLPFLAFSRLRIYSLRSINRIISAGLPESLVRPTLLLTSSSFLLAYSGNNSLDARVAITLELFSVLISFIIGSFLLSKSLPNQIFQVKGKVLARSWLTGTLPMLLIGSMYAINQQTDSVMLGILASPASVGIYAVANRGSSLISFIPIAFDGSLSMLFATSYAEGETYKLRSLVKKTCRIIFTSCLITSIILVIFTNQYLFLFGNDFLAGKSSMVILIFGQIVNALTGSVTTLLIMTGYEKLASFGIGISSISNVLLNYLLIPIWGIEGAATATAASVIIWNILLAIFTKKRMGFWPLPL